MPSDKAQSGNAACDAELAGQRCEREAGHSGFHLHGDDRKVEGLTAWGDSAARRYDVADMTGERPLINGRPLPDGVTMQDWIRLTQAPGFYGWLNAVRGCVTGRYWRLTEKVGWCGV